MSERYTRLFALPGRLYSTDSPVVIAAGALLKDNQTGRVLTQLKLRNIGKKPIKAVTVMIFPQDTIGKPLGEPVRYQYLDLYVERDTEFGQKIPVMLPDRTTREYGAAVTEVYFSDNSAWNGNAVAWELLPPPKRISDTITNAELQKQYLLEYGQTSVYAFQQVSDLWYCTCGALNHQSESSCHSCGKSFKVLSSFDLDALKKKCNVRLEQERQEREEAARRAEEEARTEAQKAAEKAKKAAEVKRKRLKIISIAGSLVALIIVLVILLNTLIIPAVKINNAKNLASQNKYGEAIKTLDGMNSERAEDTRNEIRISEAKYLASKSDYTTAINKLNGIDGAEAAGLVKEYAAEAAELFEKEGKLPFAAAFLMKAGLDEKTRSKYYEYTRRSIVSAGYNHTLGLKPDGKVVSTGDNKNGKCSVNDWENVTCVAAGEYFSVGLKADGTAIQSGYSEFSDRQIKVSGWKDVVNVVSGNFNAIGVKSNGKVVAGTKSAYNDVSKWNKIIDVSIGHSHYVGLKSDGTAVASGSNLSGQTDVAGWNNLVAVSAGNSHTVGLRADGTLVTTGSNKSGQCNVTDLKDIVAVSAGDYHTVCLKADGTVIAVGNNQYGQCDVSDWKDIVAVSAGYNYTVGVKSDGTAVAVGLDENGQCDVEDWKLW